MPSSAACDGGVAALRTSGEAAPLGVDRQNDDCVAGQGSEQAEGLRCWARMHAAAVDQRPPPVLSAPEPQGQELMTAQHERASTGGQNARVAAGAGPGIRQAGRQAGRRPGSTLWQRTGTLQADGILDWYWLAGPCDSLPARVVGIVWRAQRAQRVARHKNRGLALQCCSGGAGLLPANRAAAAIHNTSGGGLPGLWWCMPVDCLPGRSAGRRRQRRRNACRLRSEAHTRVLQPAEQERRAPQQKTDMCSEGWLADPQRAARRPRTCGADGAGDVCQGPRGPDGVGGAAGRHSVPAHPDGAPKRHIVAARHERGGHTLHASSRQNRGLPYPSARPTPAPVGQGRAPLRAACLDHCSAGLSTASDADEGGTTRRAAVGAIPLVD